MNSDHIFCRLYVLVNKECSNVFVYRYSQSVALTLKMGINSKKIQNDRNKNCQFLKPPAAKGS